MKKFVQSMAMVMAGVCAGSALAAVSAEEAKQLGGPVLTAFGAEKAGNKDGTIPEYKGEVLKTPAGYDPDNTPGNLVDPWNEKPLFTITAQNASQYADKLDGYAEVFKKYPNFRMDIYPSHRTMTYPKYVIDNTLKNAGSCKTVDGGLRLEGCYGGVPFSIPKTGEEVMWNHLLAFEGLASRAPFDSVLITSEGKAMLQNRAVNTSSYPFYDPKRTTVNGPNDIYWQMRIDSSGPPRKAGEKIMVIDAVDFMNVGRRAYQYIPGQRRVKLAPDIAYDTPSPIAGGGQTTDESKVFIGALDRYHWKLVGKKEKFIPYNQFKMTDYKACPGSVVFTKNFPNPDCVRWELHRVWVVEAMLKPGARHIYHKRKFYFDEDSYAAGMGENYDAAGKIYRLPQLVWYPLYEGKGTTAGMTQTLDLQTGGWVVLGHVSERGFGPSPIAPPPAIFYSPEALAGEGIR